MAKASSTLNFLTFEEIINHNRDHIRYTKGLFMGTDNLRTPGSLRWVVNAIQYSLFGVDPYPTIEEKAAQLAWVIIDGHVFHDANKRTGISTMLAFFEANGYILQASDDELIEIALKIANRSQSGYDVNSLVAWLRERIKPV